ncbi:MAG TPA: hypothetical protein VM238_18420 [Phycisphaerae bacterium]|nr:hypothetical protein [Phycisphaerae bacterium]
MPWDTLPCFAGETIRDELWDELYSAVDERDNLNVNAIVAPPVVNAGQELGSITAYQQAVIDLVDVDVFAIGNLLPPDGWTKEQPDHFKAYYCQGDPGSPSAYVNVLDEQGVRGAPATPNQWFRYKAPCEPHKGLWNDMRLVLNALTWKGIRYTGIDPKEGDHASDTRTVLWDDRVAEFEDAKADTFGTLSKAGAPQEGGPFALSLGRAATYTWAWWDEDEITIDMDVYYTDHLEYTYNTAGLNGYTIEKAYLVIDARNDLGQDCWDQVDIDDHFWWAVFDDAGVQIGVPKWSGTKDAIGGMYQRGYWYVEIPGADAAINKVGNTTYQLRYMDDVTDIPAGWTWNPVANDYINGLVHGRPCVFLYVKIGFDFVAPGAFQADAFQDDAFQV